MKPFVCSIPEAGHVLDLSRDGAYQAAKRDEIPVIEIGRKKIVPLAKLAQMLGVDVEKLEKIIAERRAALPPRI